MNIGVVARATNRGLGIQTMEVARNLRARVLVVDIDNPSSALHPTIRDRFPGAPIVRCRPGWRLEERKVRGWLEGLDAVYTAETTYDPRFAAWAADAGALVSVHLNPEFGGVGWGLPESGPQWWSPTSWRLEHLPTGTQVVALPVATDRWPERAEPHRGRCRWLHVAGKAALADRNGTTAVVAALPLLREPCTVTIVTQDNELPAMPRLPDHVEVHTVIGGVDDYWRLYEGHDALVMPRRYGGLCLPVQEAMGAGLAVAMTNCAPNPTTWPVVPIPSRFGHLERMPAGEIPVAEVEPEDVAATMDQLADPEVRVEHQFRARGWAAMHSWYANAGFWRRALAGLVGAVA